MNSKPIIIPELTSLRFLFMMVILIHHITSIPYMGAPPVAFFFILSGFSLSLGYRGKIVSGNFSYKGFLKKRFLKFYSIHWFVLVLLIIRQIVREDPGLVYLVPNILLLQSYIPIKEYFYAYNSPSWYLCNTIFYCVLFPYIIRYHSKISKQKRIHFSLVLITIYISLNIIIPSEYSLSIYYVNPFLRVFDFLVGICLADFFLFVVKDNNSYYRARLLAKRKWIVPLVMLIVIIAVLLTFTPEWELQCRSFIFWIPMGLLIFSVSLFSQLGGVPILKSKLFVFFGKLSFPFYMFHVPIIWYINKFLSTLNVVQNDYTRLCATFIVTMFISYLYNRYIDDYLMKKLKNKI